jgi:UDPglucose 6-dehydrogenase
MKVAVIGTGYVGLVAGAGLAHSGNDVVCVDIDEAKIEGLRKGRIPIYEPGLEPLVKENLEAGRLSFTTDLADAVRRSRILFIAVGTPPGEDGSADLQHVLGVARSIGRAMDGERIVITKSTVPVGTARRVREAIEAETPHPVHVCSNPEFLKEGAAVDDFLKPDRVVLGVDDPDVARELEELFQPFVRTGNRVLTMDVASAEITKYAANAMLATRISFMNMIADLCRRTGADVGMVRMGVGSDNRIGSSFLFPGIGYGGSCFPKDVKALIRTMGEMEVDSGILTAVESVNEVAKRFVLDTVLAELGPDLEGRRFAVWGLSFKPNTDDMREAPSLVTIRGILERGGTVVAHDPAAMDEARSHYLGESIVYAGTNYDALDGADALIIHTEWHPYRHPDFRRMRRQLRGNLVVDGRNLYDPSRMAEGGFRYHSVGRLPVGVHQPTPRESAGGDSVDKGLAGAQEGVVEGIAGS